jgi:hypothetical protein
MTRPHVVPSRLLRPPNFEMMATPQVSLASTLQWESVQIKSIVQESPKIASHSPFYEHIRRRYFSLLDCAARTQSGAKKSGLLTNATTEDFEQTGSLGQWMDQCNSVLQRRVWDVCAA